MRREDIVLMLSSLKEEQRQAIRLRCQFGMEDEEIARSMNVSPASAKRYLAIAYAKLRVDGHKKLRRFKVLLEQFWPVMRETSLPPLPAGVEEMEEPPNYLLRRVDEDNELLKRLGWDELRALVEEIPPTPPPAPSRLRWFIAGLLFSGLILASGLYALSELRPMGAARLLPIIVEKETVPVTITPDPNAPTIPPIVVTATPDPNAPTVAPIVQTFVATQLVTQIVTATPLPATQIPAPTATPETTQPGTILNVGDTWRQGGAEFKLLKVEVRTDDVVAYFAFTNRKPSPVSIVFTGADNFVAIDNLGRKLTTCIAFGGTCATNKRVVQPGETLTDLTYVNIAVNTSDLALTEILLKVVSISTITEAQWRIPIAH